ncbi:MAG: hypothetical protein ACOC22_00260 [bacterium]
MENNIIRYGSKNFSEIRTDLIAYIRQTYPEVIKDFTDSSVGAVLIDINAGVTNNLGFNIDRTFQETQLDYAQQRASILNIAKNMGFNIPARRPSVTIVDFTVIIPVLGDRPDPSYYPVLEAGAQVIGGGQTFETREGIDWSSPVSNLGDPNRSIIPNLDNNGNIQSYSVTKREVVVNGSSTIFKRVINTNNVKSFFSVTLPDTDILEIDGVILKEGTNFSSNPENSEFEDENIKFYEVDYLAQQRIFVDDYQASRNLNDDSEGLKIGKWIDVQKKFIKEFTANNFCKLTFGSGDADVDAFKEGFLKEGVTNKAFLDNFLNNTALGQRLKAGHTLFIKYRTGGGSGSNVGTGVLSELGRFNLSVNGSRQDFNQNVRRSLSVNNPIPAIGGNDGLSIEQIRQLIKYNFSGRNRAVTLNDYLVQLYKMPGRFGSPFRANVFKDNNKVLLSILGIGNDGKLSSKTNSLLKENIAEYLSQYRMINDYVEVTDGKIFNLAFDIDVYIQNVNDNQVANSIINIVRSFFNVNNHEMNEDIFLGRLEQEILDINGVTNILEIKVFNKVGGNYSNNVISQEILNPQTGEIRKINNTIYSTRDSMFEIKFPQRDIRVFLRKRNE